MSAIRRLQKELDDIQKNPPPNYQLGIVENDMFRWKAVIDGPAGSPYEGGKIVANFVIPEGYPHKPPSVFFAPPVYHPNVDQKSGQPCLEIINDDKNWPPKTFIRKVVDELINLLVTPEPSHAVDTDIGKEFVSNKDEFNRKAREWTQNHAK